MSDRGEERRGREVPPGGGGGAYERAPNVRTVRRRGAVLYQGSLRQFFQCSLGALRVINCSFYKGVHRSRWFFQREQQKQGQGPDITPKVENRELWNTRSLSLHLNECERGEWHGIFITYLRRGGTRGVKEHKRSQSESKDVTGL